MAGILVCAIPSPPSSPPPRSPTVSEFTNPPSLPHHARTNREKPEHPYSKSPRKQSSTMMMETMPMPTMMPSTAATVVPSGPDVSEPSIVFLLQSQIFLDSHNYDEREADYLDVARTQLDLELAALLTSLSIVQHQTPEARDAPHILVNEGCALKEQESRQGLATEESGLEVFMLVEESGGTQVRLTLVDHIPRNHSPPPPSFVLFE
ncbi:hypothetical protein EW146_g9298, partial [Bondarzewia mesenterica]